jgi:hypothetical protein
MARSSYISGLQCVLLAVFEIFAPMQIASKAQAAGNEFSQADLENAARAANRKMPQVSAGGTTRTFKVEAAPGRTLRYHSIFVGHRLSELNVPAFMAEVTPRVRQQACSNADLIPAIRAGVVVAFSYWADDGGYIGEVRVLSAYCR